MTRIKRLTRKECETAMPMEIVVLEGGTEKTLARMKASGVIVARNLAKGAVVAIRDGKSVIVKRRTKWLCDGAGLWLVVSPGLAPDTVNRSWMFQWNPGETVIAKSGKARRLQKRIGLGSLNTVSLERARELADACRRQLQDGKDVLSKRAATARPKIEEKKLRPFRAAVDEYLRRHGDAWSPRHGYNWKKSFDHVPSLLDIPASTIDRTMVVEALRPVWDKSPDTGQRLRGRIETLLEACMAWEWRDKGDNPAAWKTLKHSFRPRSQLKPVVHHDALPYADAPEFMAKLRAYQIEQTKVGRPRAPQENRKRGLELLILTAVRTGEIVSATGEEFDLDSDKPTWTVPAFKTKTGKRTGEPHVIPLSPAAVACLRQVGVEPGQRVFDFHERALYRLAKELDGRVSVHGFRATFSSWAADMGYPREVTEAALDHQVGNEVERAYRRTTWIEQRRVLLRDWADYLDGKAVKAIEAMQVPLLAPPAA